MTDDLYYDDIDIGDEIDAVERSVSLDQVKTFLAIRGISGPSRFTDAAKAQSEGLPHPIVPGAMNSAIMAQLLTGWSPTAVLKKMEVVFRQMVPHNTPLEVKGVVTSKDMVDDVPQVNCDVFIESEEGTIHVIGHATVILPVR